MLKSTRWICWRCALHWTTQIATAIASAARRPEERSARERADGADRDRAVVELERERLPHADERDHGEEPDHVRRGAEDRAHDARGDADRADEADEQAESESRAGGSAGRWSCAPCAGAPARGSASGTRASGSWWSPSSGTATRRWAAVGGHQQRLRAGAEDAVAALELRAVDGEVGLVDERVRILRVLRVAGDADRDGGADRLARRLDVVELARRPRGGSARRSRAPARAASPAGGSRTPRRRSGPARRSGAARRGRPRRCPSAPRRRRDGRRCC